jgi:tetratricopeptide (TPR) repeat protein
MNAGTVTNPALPVNGDKTLQSGDTTLPNHAAFGYCSGMKHFTALLGLTLLIALPVFAQQTPDDQYIAIYNLMQQADTMDSSGQARQALDEYTSAINQLQKFQKVYPDWNPTIVKFRMKYLTQKINGLTAQLPAPAPAPATPAAAATLGAAPAPAPDLQAQLSALRAQMQNLQAENQNLQAKLKEALSVQPATADTQALVKAQAQIESLTKQNDLLKAGLAQSKTNAAVAATSTEDKQALAATNQKLEEQTERANKLALENQALQAKLQSLMASPDSIDALRAENAMLKRQVAQLAATTNAPPGGSDTEIALARARAQIASLQSDNEINLLEKAALENRLRQLPATTNAETATNTMVASHPRPRLVMEETDSTAQQASTQKSPPSPKTIPPAEDNSANSNPDASAQLDVAAQNYFAAGQYDKAAAIYQTILQGDKTNVPALSGLAAVELEQNKLADAEQHLKMALAQNPNDTGSLCIYGYLKLRQQKTTDAFNALNHAAQLAPDNPQIQNYLGVAENRKGMRAEAKKAFLKAIEIDPAYGAAHNNLAVIYMTEQPPEAEIARFHYQKALENGQPRNPNLEKALAAKGVPVNP